MFIIGTAGHIDHGKSALVQALTSIDPDRLPDEKRQGMTIDLGFAYLPLSSGEVIGIVDVPGHKDLVRNVIAGVWGIDAALFVIAANEGWMPQTEEHLQVLNLLYIKHGIVVINKVDLADDLDWLDLIEEDIRGRLKGTELSDAPLVRVSAKDGTNIEELKRNIEELVSKLAPRRNIGKPRLPIDRVFTVRGSGTVVTGTLIDGSLSTGQSVVIYPKNLHTRIRTLETYKERTDTAQPGTRIAINLMSLEKESLRRGDIVFGSEKQVKLSRTFDILVDLIPRTNSLKRNTELKVYLGTGEIVGRLVLLEGGELKPRQTALAQLRFREHVAARIGDHIIIRKLSPSETIGGGTILDPLASRHKSKDTGEVILSLRRMLNLDIANLIIAELDKNKYIKVEDILVASQYSAVEVESCVQLLQGQGKLIIIGPWVLDFTYWQNQVANILNILSNEHSLHHLQRGLCQAELQSRLGLPKEAFDKLITNLINSGQIVVDRDTVFLSTHKPYLLPEQEVIASKILYLFEKDQVNPPTKREVVTQISGSDAIIRFMCEQNSLIELSDGVLFEYRHYQAIKDGIVNFLRSNGTISIQDVRELLGLSRKYILPLFSRLDEEGITERRGDDRILASRYG
jgi:selenocysteine-specific elongation factor